MRTGPGPLSGPLISIGSGDLNFVVRMRSVGIAWTGQLPISFFGGATQSAVLSSTSVAVATSSSHHVAPHQVSSNSATSASAASQGHQTSLSTTSALRAEVLWCLNTAIKHHSFSSNHGIGELFQIMFPDSDIAKNFAMGKDKTA